MSLNKKIGILFLILYTLFHIPFVIQPTINHYYSIMQSDRASVCRNYYLESNNFFEPRVDVRGDLSGITSIEFPLHNYIVSIFYKIFRTQWLGIGRLISYIFGFLSLYLIYKIFKIEIKNANLMIIIFPAVLLSSFFYLISITIIPETIAMFFALLSFYISFQKRCLRNYLLFFVSFTLAILIRPYYFFFGIPILINIIDFKKNESFFWLITGVMSISLFYSYYFYYFPNLNNKYGLNYFFRGDLNLSHINYYFSFQLLWDIFYTFGKRYILCLLPIFFYGSYLYYRRITLKKINMLSPSNQLFLIFLFSIIFFPIIIGNHFVNHDYYFGACFPFISFLNLLAFISIHNKSRKLFYLTISFLFIILIMINSFRFKEREDFKWLNNNKISFLEGTDKNDLFVIDGCNPGLMYIIERKGWLFNFFVQEEEDSYSLPCMKSEIYHNNESHYNYDELIFNNLKLNDFKNNALFQFYKKGAKYALIRKDTNENEFFLINLQKYFQ